MQDGCTDSCPVAPEDSCTLEHGTYITWATVLPVEPKVATAPFQSGTGPVGKHNTPDIVCMCLKLLDLVHCVVVVHAQLHVICATHHPLLASNKLCSTNWQFCDLKRLDQGLQVTQMTADVDLAAAERCSEQPCTASGMTTSKCRCKMCFPSGTCW